MERDDHEVARGFSGRAIPAILAVIAVVYLGAVWTEAAKSGTSAKWLPAPLAYFTQLAALFPRATVHAFDYRVEAWRCRDQQWVEIDPSRWFRIDADNKENRFHRAVYFFYERGPHRQTMQALDDYFVDHYNADNIDLRAQGKGGDAMGGVRFSKVIIPFGKPGDGAARYEKKPLSAFAEDQRKELYYTRKSRREERCALLGR